MDELPVNPAETPTEGMCDCGCCEFLPEMAVMDTWATSSLSPQINARWGRADEHSDMIPMSMRTQAHEIIRTWAFYTIVKSLYHTGQIPWKDIMICGFVLAKKGEKLSKSKNNAELSPQALIGKHSADVIRYWAANARLGSDTMFSEDELDIAKRFVTKLWNASKFSISHLTDIDFSCIPALFPIDRWILERIKAVTKKTTTLLNEYETGTARHEIDTFFWNDFCDNYIEIVKERLYEPEKHGQTARQSAQYTLYHVLLGILKLYAPYVPHITEYVYQSFFAIHEQSKSLHLLLWDMYGEPDADILLFGERLKAAISEMRRYKSERNLSMRAVMEKWTIHIEESLLPLFHASEGDLKACARTFIVDYELL